MARLFLASLAEREIVSTEGCACPNITESSAVWPGEHHCDDGMGSISWWEISVSNSPPLCALPPSQSHVHNHCACVSLASLCCGCHQVWCNSCAFPADCHIPELKHCKWFLDNVLYFPIMAFFRLVLPSPFGSPFEDKIILRFSLQSIYIHYMSIVVTELFTRPTFSWNFKYVQTVLLHI